MNAGDAQMRHTARHMHTQWGYYANVWHVRFPWSSSHLHRMPCERKETAVMSGTKRLCAACWDLVNPKTNINSCVMLMEERLKAEMCLLCSYRFTCNGAICCLTLNIWFPFLELQPGTTSKLAGVVFETWINPFGEKTNKHLRAVWIILNGSFYAFSLFNFS